MEGLDISNLLPASLLLPPRLAAHKYLMVCTLTVAAWDTLVLSPRAYKLFKTPGWPFLKISFHVLRVLMPAEFIITAVAFFDSKWSLERCQHFYLFEPIVTAFLMAFASVSLAVRLYAIWDKSKLVMAVLGPLLFVQIVTQAVCCAFYRVVPLKPGQGCIAGPKENWVGIYWLAPTLFYTAAFAFACMRSAKYVSESGANLWKLFLRDGLNLYGAILVVNLVNMLFWFIIKPTGDSDTIKTIVTSMTAVLTTTMTLRVILSVKGSLSQGGTYTGMSSMHTHSSNVASSRQKGEIGVPHHSSGTVGGGHMPNRHSISQARSANHQTYTIEEMRAKAERDWAVDERDVDDGKYVIDDDADADDGASSKTGGKGAVYGNEKGTLQTDDESTSGRSKNAGGIGVKVTIDREFQ